MLLHVSIRSKVVVVTHICLCLTIGGAAPYLLQGGGAHSYYFKGGGGHPLCIAKVVNVEVIIPISYHVYLFNGGGGHPHLFCAGGGANPKGGHPYPVYI